MQRLDKRLQYSGSIFDAHTHAINETGLKLLTEVENEFGIHQALLICHSLDIKKYAVKNYPGRFIFAKYFSGAFRFEEGLEPMLREIATLKDEGYHLLKMQSAPVMRSRASVGPDLLRMDSEEMAPFFDALREEDVPFLLHLSDPDTYYETRYLNNSHFSSKERDLRELEGVLRKYPDVHFQIAHFASQPEIHRLDNLGKWFDTYSNFNIDISSARWISRELSKDYERAREFVLKYQDRMHFGTDCVAFTPEWEYYSGRHLALRLLLETDVRNEPLPFIDADTVATGGTFINGLNLPQSVLKKMYWENGMNFFSKYLE